MLELQTPRRVVAKSWCRTSPCTGPLLGLGGGLVEVVVCVPLPLLPSRVAAPALLPRRARCPAPPGGDCYAQNGIAVRAQGTGGGRSCGCRRVPSTIPSAACSSVIKFKETIRTCLNQTGANASLNLRSQVGQTLRVRILWVRKNVVRHASFRDRRKRV